MGKLNKRRIQQIGSSSLPDIVFILLFFFMTVTVMNDKELLLDISLPAANQDQRLEDNSLVSYIYIGKIHKNGETSIQLQDHFAQLEEIASFIEEEVHALPEEKKEKRITSLRVDEKVKMQKVTEVRRELRKVHALKIMYGTKK